ncbi:MAG TPA: bifunctional UDP-N-acetylglucosamine diphosphorylase/glucosamine-1-phosphate N-acetyltransferase GlmU [Acidobacteriota bacterium]|jgi:bifunctional UDP-N-acetylglucosamine pyrophosphorylase/glucosamine-1-phosphate N-acetyltransferase|nr:bifunctional UDP-N-acetylglucosamine diphosphorylase/glucosamine-1-phosphate N-acetyltransferase GlmU [Acidobacteriota bacterium]
MTQPVASHAKRIYPCCVVILAAGKGTRMRSEHAKVLHPLCGRPMILYPVETAMALEPEKILVVIGYEADQVKEALQEYPVEFVLQEEQKGTGHAVIQAIAALQDFEGNVVILYGDSPLLAADELRALIHERERTGTALALLIARMQPPTGYGRIIRSGSQIERIVEERDATPEEKKIDEVNPGIYCFDAAALKKALAKLNNKNAQGEYYLTDTFEVLRKMGYKAVALTSLRPETLWGVNTRVELAETERKIWLRRARQFMLQGVSILHPETFFASHETKIGRDTVIYPNVIIEGATEIGQKVTIFPNTRIIDSRIGAEAQILDSCVITESEVGPGTTVGPFAHLRAHATVGAGCRIGNFVEVKNSHVGDKSKAAHLTYLGDAEIGKDVNIGAGTITCNYDGVAKNPTYIGDGAFIGSDSQLIAPVRVGEGAYVAAGSSITEDIPPYSLGIARGRQVNKEGWVKDKKARKRSKTDLGAEPPE